MSRAILFWLFACALIVWQYLINFYQDGHHLIRDHGIMAHVYISYAREDSDFVGLLEDDLNEQEHPTWRDTKQIAPGREWEAAIEEALNQAYALVVVLSQGSAVSSWVIHEIQFAQANDIPIIAVQIEPDVALDALPDVPLINFQRIRLAQGLEELHHYRQGLKQLIQALNQLRPILVYLRDLGSSSDDVRETAARELGELGDLYAAERLIQLLADPDSDVRYAAAEALGKLRSTAAIKPLIRLLGDDDPDVCATSCMALAAIGAQEAIDPVMTKLENRDRFVREAAARALGQLKASEAVRMLIYMLRNDPISDVRRAATAALKQIGGGQAERALKRASNNNQ
jgi:hypothetical protein